VIEHNIVISMVRAHDRFIVQTVLVVKSFAPQAAMRIDVSIGINQIFIKNPIPRIRCSEERPMPPLPVLGSQRSLSTVMVNPVLPYRDSADYLRRRGAIV
jgi:hypothetical protein